MLLQLGLGKAGPRSHEHPPHVSCLQGLWWDVPARFAQLAAMVQEQVLVVRPGNTRPACVPTLAWRGTSKMCIHSAWLKLSRLFGLAA